MKFIHKKASDDFFSEHIEVETLENLLAYAETVKMGVIISKTILDDAGWEITDFDDFLH